MQTSSRLKIKEWNEEDRPREKLLVKGISALSNAELIAIIIGSGNSEDTAVDLSKKILGSVQNRLKDLAKMSIKELMNFKGIGEAKAISISACMELGRRQKLEEAFVSDKIDSSYRAFEIFSPILSDLNHEEFWVLLLNRSNKVISKVLISRGGISGTVVDVKLIMKSAIDNLASGMILVHNHPSGNCNASREDLNITQKTKDACNIMDIVLHDHIIIAHDSYLSMADKNLF